MRVCRKLGVSTVKDHARFTWCRVVGHDALKPREGKQFRLSYADLMNQEIDASTVFDHVFIEARVARDDHCSTAVIDAIADSGLDRVAVLLREKTGTDPLLLRYALALQAQHSKELAAQVEKLRDRFAASRLRGDRVHLREEARFTLHLLAAPAAALELAQENWQVQKEPADVRILLEAALAAHDAATIAAVTDWLKETRLEDVQLARLLPEAKHPT
jgi:hypothetical protein